LTTTKQYLYRIQPTRPEMLASGLTDRESAVMAEHFAYLQRLRADGTLILAGRTLNADADSFGIAILRAVSDEAACAIMRDDPAVRHGVMRATLFPYRVALISESNAAPDDG
jgi:uncharacterized protein YciI